MSTQSVLSRDNAFLQAPKRQPFWSGFIEITLEWRRRARSRRELARLSHLDVKDISYPANIATEKNKPFWRS
jgi:uncharacterized protein YjiS (DUF1127 family)